jgi:molybdopterin/thiamine biosynthesis adenylyltransferase
VGLRQDFSQRECAGSAALAMLTAGLLLGEARCTLMPLPGDAPLEAIRINAPPLGSLRPCHMVMVGAGASASAAAVGIAPLLAGGCSLAIYDPDVVEPTNRSRSWLFERPGQPKVQALARWLSRQAPGARVTPVVEAAAGDLLEREPEAGAVLLNTDTWRSRADVGLALAARSAGPPWRSGDSATRAGRRVAFNVGTSPGGVTHFAMGAGAACLRCRRPDLDELVAEEAEREARPHSCANQSQGSHIITNMIGGGLQARALERYLCEGSVEPAVIAYDPGHAQRLVHRSPQTCDCYGQRDGATWGQQPAVPVPAPDKA